MLFCTSSIHLKNINIQKWNSHCKSDFWLICVILVSQEWRGHKTRRPDWSIDKILRKCFEMKSYQTLHLINFPIFALKLECLQNMKTIVFNVKWPSLIGETEKLCINLEKSFVRLSLHKSQFELFLPGLNISIYSIQNYVDLYSLILISPPFLSII